jgi:hypothetical protein
MFVFNEYPFIYHISKTYKFFMENNMYFNSSLNKRQQLLLIVYIITFSILICND